MRGSPRSTVEVNGQLAGAFEILMNAPEPKSSQQVEETLTAYAKDAKNHGALLLSVIGGKMSEGINFADDMARCVVVVGLPYPDCTDPVLNENPKRRI
jgi:chromosome transmission fidelity protein 1